MGRRDRINSRRKRRGEDSSCEEKESKVIKFRKRRKKVIDSDQLISSGSTLLNLACSDSTDGAYTKGAIVNLIGDTSAGKSILNLTMLADIAYDERFDDYGLYDDDGERTHEFDLNFLFGNKFEKRVQFERSKYFEDAYDNVRRLIDKGRSFIYVIDSIDSLKTKYEESKEQTNLRKRDKGRKEEGSYGDGKAMLLHKFSRQLIEGLDETGSLVVWTSQTKDNWGVDAMFNPKIVTGGNAIKFYPSHRVWLTIRNKEKKHDREIGAQTTAKVIKNKLTGKRRNVDFPIWYDYGVDDITSMIKFLTSDYGNNHWKQRQVNGKKKWVAEEFNISARYLSQMVDEIERAKLIDETKKICGDVWREIEESIRLDRVPRYCE